MTREEAIAYLKVIWNRYKAEYEIERETLDAYHMAIEALQTDVVHCKDCIHKEHCHETVAHTKEHDGFREHWSETIEWCSRGERKGGDDE